MAAPPRHKSFYLLEPADTAGENKLTKHLRLTLSVLLPAILSSQFAWADEAPTPQQPFNAPTEADVKTKAQENEKALRMDPAIVDVIQLLKQDKEDEARKALEGELKRNASNVDLLELLALLEFKGGSYSDAAKRLQVALLDAEKIKDMRKHLILQKRIGDC